MEKIDKLEKKIDKLAIHNSFGDSWLDIPKVCAILKISKRTLQTYRDNGILSFSQHGTKIYFKTSDIQKYLEDNYKPAFKNDKNINYDKNEISKITSKYKKKQKN